MENNFKSLFISIPKCGSQTVEKILNLNNQLINLNLNSEIIHENHQRLKILDKKYDLTNIYTFAFVRNPFERIRSWYYYHERVPPYNKYRSLNKWIEAECPHHWDLQCNTHWDVLGISPLLQYNFIDGNKQIEFIGKMENFKEDFQHIILHLNDLLEIEIEYEDIKVNATDKKDKISKKNKKLIYDMFRKDFDYFGYALE